MTKEEAWKVWGAASRRSFLQTQWEKEIDRHYFENWWRGYSEIPNTMPPTKNMENLTGDGLPYEYISSTSTAPGSFFASITSPGESEDSKD